MAQGEGLFALTPPVIVREPGTTMHGQIEEWLAEAIEAGRLAPGDRMPTEQDLAAWLGVSRMTLRHALATLARRGLVDRAVGLGLSAMSRDIVSYVLRDPFPMS